MSSSMPFLDFRFWIEIFDNFNSAVGVLLNSLLLYLIINKTSLRMREYRPILIQNCLVDVLYNIVGFGVKAQVDFKNGYFYMMCTGFFTHIPTPWNNILIHFWVFSLFYCLTSLPVQFIYRYFLIVQEKTLSLFQYFGILAFPTVFAFIYTVTDTLVFSYKEESREFLTKQLSDDSFYFAGIPNFVVGDIRSLELKLQFGYSYFLVTTSYCIIFYTNYKIYKKLSKMKDKMSMNTLQLQKQMTYTLFAQAIVPTIICIIPIGIALTMAVAKANIPGIGQILSLLYSCIPVANPLTTIIVISHYRNACLTFIKTYFCPKKIAPSVSYVPADISITQNQIRQLNNIHGSRRNQLPQIQQNQD